LRRVREYIEAHACETFALDELAMLAGATPWRLLRDFQRHHGITPHALQLCLRANRARRWLREGMAPCDAALAAGFADQSHLTRMFKRYAALTPGAYRRALTG
jgi:AraC-like DNA-binding protein